MEKNNQLKQNHLLNLFDANIKERCEKDERVKYYVVPKKVIWETQKETAFVENSTCLLENTQGQISLDVAKTCDLHNNGERAAILLDFGMELQGGVQILTSRAGEEKRAKIRVRFGESAMEAMSEIEGTTATNDHAPRDIEVEVGFMSMVEVGGTGFRFVRIDLLDEDCILKLKSIKATFVYKDLDYKGSFKCNDALLNKIWLTGAYTVQLNTQNFIWDGVKRDRLVWIGDMHPETSTIQAVFNDDDAVYRSLDFIREETPLPAWMNGIPSYSMWWIIIHYDWFMHTGDVDYLLEQKEYMIGLVKQLSDHIDENGKDNTPNMRFLDWPSAEDKEAVDAGVQSIHIMAMEAAGNIFRIYDEQALVDQCEQDLKKLKSVKLKHNGKKQAAALMVLAGLESATQINDKILSVDGAKRISTFMGYYILKARAMAGDIQGCLECIRTYWGGMLSLGATTFWEDFDIEWMENAARIDEVITDDRVDIHATYGNYCYKGYRHSLCHGWASGPTPWLSEYVLGINVLEAGCKKIKIEPHLGDLEWAEGTYPTPLGIIEIRHEKQSDGTIKSNIKAPEGIEVVGK